MVPASLALQIAPEYLALFHEAKSAFWRGASGALSGAMSWLGGGAAPKVAPPETRLLASYTPKVRFVAVLELFRCNAECCCAPCALARA